MRRGDAAALEGRHQARMEGARAVKALPAAGCLGAASLAAGRKAVPGWRAAPAVRHRVDLVAPYPDRRAVARAVVMKDQGSLEALAEARMVDWVEPCPVQTAVPLVATAAWAVVVTEVGGLVEGLAALAAV